MYNIWLIGGAALSGIAALVLSAWAAYALAGAVRNRQWCRPTAMTEAAIALYERLNDKQEVHCRLILT